MIDSLTQLFAKYKHWVPGESPAEQFNATSPVELQHWEKEGGGSVIPFFSSEAAMREAITDEQPWLRLPARTLFEMTLGEAAGATGLGVRTLANLLLK
ncbi:hypothetical protein CRX72_25040 [Pantoea sp. BRM17]|nr:hypothetical protein CRX72_25040 [Pantoea sp. BRM17]